MFRLKFVFLTIIISLFFAAGSAVSSLMSFAADIPEFNPNATTAPPVTTAETTTTQEAPPATEPQTAPATTTQAAPPPATVAPPVTAPPATTPVQTTPAATRPVMTSTQPETEPAVPAMASTSPGGQDTEPVEFDNTQYYLILSSPTFFPIEAGRDYDFTLTAAYITIDRTQIVDIPADRTVTFRFGDNTPQQFRLSGNQLHIESGLLPNSYVVNIYVSDGISDSEQPITIEVEEQPKLEQPLDFITKPEYYIAYVGQSFVLHPNASGGRWQFDTQFFTQSSNGDIVTFTPLKEGNSAIIYECLGEILNADMIIKTEAADSTDSGAVQTTAASGRPVVPGEIDDLSGILYPVLSALPFLAAIVLGIRAFFKKR